MNTKILRLAIVGFTLFTSSWAIANCSFEIENPSTRSRERYAFVTDSQTGIKTATDGIYVAEIVPSSGTQGLLTLTKGKPRRTSPEKVGVQATIDWSGAQIIWTVSSRLALYVTCIGTGEIL